MVPDFHVPVLGIGKEKVCWELWKIHDDLAIHSHTCRIDTTVACLLIVVSYQSMPESSTARMNST
jgi:hypothetical protein